MRCKACDAVLEPSEIIWKEEEQEHEPLCRVCRDALDEELEISLRYEEDFNLFEDN